MKQLFLFLVINICVFKITIAQKEYNNWFFGSRSALNFGTAIPAFVPGSNLVSEEGCSSISDKDGNLLFYTNGVTVWDRNHAVMPNGSGLNGDVGSTQSALITNHPGNNALYYIFTTPKEGSTTGLAYSVVNMSLNGGLGDIDVGLGKNVNFFLPVCEKLTAVKHRNGNDIWVITRRYKFDQFVEYLIDCDGLLAFPTFYNAGSTVNTPTNTPGYLKASPDGKKLASANFQGNIDLYDFNDATGAITNHQTISIDPSFGCGPYGLEFSPDSRLLYLSEAHSCNTPYTYEISQYQLDAADIAASKVVLDGGSTNLAGALQLGPDNKIYIAYNQAGFIGSITNPNVQGTGCTLIKQYINLPAPALSGMGLPNMSTGYTGYNKSLLGDDTTICEGTTKIIRLNIPNTDYLWSDGSIRDTFSITSAGQYWVRITHGSCVYSDTINISVQKPPVFSLDKDTAICQNKFPYILKKFIPNATYLWQDGSTDSTFTVSKAGWYWMQATVNGCAGTDSVLVKELAVDSFSLGADTVICEGKVITLTAGPASASYLWNTGSTSRTISVSTAGIYWCESTNGSGCSYRDSKTIGSNPVPAFSLGNDTTLCQDKFPLLLQTSIPGATYLWQDGSTDPSFSAPAKGWYWMEATLNGCSTRDSVLLSANPVPAFNLGADSIICGSQPLTLTAGPGFSSYLWSTGSTSNSISINTTGVYWCEVTNASGCSYRDSINLAFNPKSIVNLGNDTTICNNLPWVIGQNISNATYLWQDGSTNAFYNVNNSGVYWVEATVNGCSARDSIKVSVGSMPTFNLGADLVVCGSEPVNLTVTRVFSTYLWSTGSTSRSIDVNTTGIYWCEVTNGLGCSYRDSISLTFKPKPVVNLGRDTSLCQDGLPLMIGQNISNATYLWQDGSTSALYSVNGSGLYWVEATVNGCSTRDTINITVGSVPTFNLGADSIICGNQPVTLTVNPAFTKYLWSTGSTSKSISVSNSGLYWCEATNASGCSYRDSINLSFNPRSIVNLGKDTSLCQTGLPLVIGQNISNASYLWQDGSTNAFYSVNRSGLYWVEATVNGCSARDSINVTVGDVTTFTLGPDTVTCSNQAVILRANQAFEKYLWNTGSTSSSIIVNASGDYWLQATNASGCSYRDTVKVNVKPAPVINLGNDISICHDKLPLQIGQSISGASYVWQDGSTNAFYSVTTAGLYWVQVEVNGCAARDSINISGGNATAISLGNDTAICNARALQLGISGSFSRYLWSTGSTNRNISVNTSGDYWLEVVSNAGCSYRDTIRVDFKSPPLFSLGRDTIICNTTSYLLDVSNAGDSYLWQDNSTKSTYLVSKTGSYHVLVSRNGCSAADTVSVVFKSTPAPDLGADKNICPGEALTLNPAVTGTAFRWQDGSRDLTYNVSTPGRYTVAVTNECGTGNDEVIISNGACKLQVPNAFTPGKSANNIFRLINANGLKDFKLQVFNRWGQQVYQTNNSNEGWDGKYKGIDQPSGIYVYIISYADVAGRTTQKGPVTLIR